jgi:hypothetical protein
VQLAVMPISSNWYDRSVHHHLFLADIRGQVKGLDRDLRIAILTDVIIGRTREELDLLRAYIHATKLADLSGTVIDLIQSKRPLVQQLFVQALSVANHNGCYDPVQDYDVLKRNIGAGPSDGHCNEMYVETSHAMLQLTMIS